MKKYISLIIPILLFSFAFVMAEDITDCKTSGWVEGTTYVLQNDLPSVSGNCFVIDANSITLNLNGKTVTGDGTGYGIFIDGYNSTTLTNGVITNFQYGVHIANSDYNTINDLQSNSNAGTNWQNSGFHLITSNYNSFNNVQANNNLHSGFIFSEVAYSNFTNVVADGNIDDGFFLDYTTYCNFENIDAINTQDGDTGGFYIFSCDGGDNCGYNTFTNINASNNLLGGFWFEYSAHNTVNGLTANNNGDIGVWLHGATYNSYTDVEALNNVAGDLVFNHYLTTTTENTFTNYNFQTYDFSDTANNEEFENTNGKIYFVGLTSSGTDLMNEVIILDNNATVNPSTNIGLNVTANITLNNIPSKTNPKIMRDGIECLNCIAFTPLDGDVLFQVPSFSSYSIEGESGGLLSGLGNTLTKSSLVKQEQLPSTENPQVPISKVSIFQGIKNFFLNLWSKIIGWF